MVYTSARCGEVLDIGNENAGLGAAASHGPPSAPAQHPGPHLCVEIRADLLSAP